MHSCSMSLGRQTFIKIQGCDVLIVRPRFDKCYRYKRPVGNIIKFLALYSKLTLPQRVSGHNVCHRLWVAVFPLNHILRFIVIRKKAHRAYKGREKWSVYLTTWKFIFAFYYNATQVEHMGRNPRICAFVGDILLKSKTKCCCWMTTQTAFRTKFGHQ